VREGRARRRHLPGHLALRRAVDGRARFLRETFCFEAVEEAAEYGRPYHVCYLGDFDRSGRDAAEALQEKLERFASERRVAIRFIHLAIEEADILEVDHSNWRVRARVGNMNAGCQHVRTSARARQISYGRSRLPASLTRSSRMICAL